jgi:hypothetical protein
LLPLWADIDVDDALELLGKDFANRHVRAYAVNQLRKADDDVSHHFTCGGNGTNGLTYLCPLSLATGSVALSASTCASTQV